MAAVIAVSVSYKAGTGYISTANHQISRSLTALSLRELRRKILVVALRGRKASEEVAVTFALDNSAQVECDRRRAAAGL